MLVIEQAVQSYIFMMVQTLGDNAYQSYIDGQQGGAYSLRLSVDWNQVPKDALSYSEQYKQTMVRDGGTLINGQMVPWVANRSEGMRKEIADIIREGIEKGKATGVKEYAGGGYPKNSIAADLEEYFGMTKSHASMVARTEVGRIRNLSTLNRYREAGIEYVRVYDGGLEDSCEECNAIDGVMWPLEYAMTNEKEHPNCVRRFGAVRKPENYTPGEAPEAGFDWKEGA